VLMMKKYNNLFDDFDLPFVVKIIVFICFFIWLLILKLK